MDFKNYFMQVVSCGAGVRLNSIHIFKAMGWPVEEIMEADENNRPS
ncbi:hypothetical protein [Dyadobacter sediminis]|nr:hypothetical protein [Dyadobacter sediminis]